MKKVIGLFLVVVIIPFFGFSQSIDNIDYISPFYNGLAAIKQNSEWAFINEKGAIVIDFRDDLVITESPEGNFPVFKNDRCLIEAKQDGISYFGYINTYGNTVIEPQYLNARNFDNGVAIVLELFKEQVGRNKALGKNVVYDKYLEAVIDTNGTIKTYVSPKRVNVILDKDFLKAPPKITSKFISDSLYAIEGENKKWEIIQANQ